MNAVNNKQTQSGYDGVVILIRTNYVDETILGLIEKLSAATGYYVAVAADESNHKLDPGPRAGKISLDFTVFRESGLYVTENAMWRCGDYGLYAALSHFPEASYFWLLEHDVRIHTEHLSDFFSFFDAHKEVDFLSCFYLPAPPSWDWRATMAPYAEKIFKCMFSPVRFSRAAVEFMLERRRALSLSYAEAVEKKYPAADLQWPNDEVFSATVLSNNNFVCKDINDFGKVFYNEKTCSFFTAASLKRLENSPPDGLIYHPVLSGDRYQQKLMKLLLLSSRNAPLFIDFLKTYGGDYYIRQLRDECGDEVARTFKNDVDFLLFELKESNPELFPCSRGVLDGKAQNQTEGKNVSDREEAENNYNLGNTYRARGELELAEKYFGKALEHFPDHPETLHNFGLLLTAISKHEQAIEYYYKALMLKPDSSEILTDLAEAYKKLHKYNEALVLGRKAMKLDPENTRVLLILGDIYGERNQYDNAILFYRLILTIDPDSVYAHRRLGYMMHHLGRHAEARSHCRTAVKLDPDNLPAKLGNCMVQIPLVHRTTGEIIQARENYRKALDELCNGVDLTDPAVLDGAKGLVGLAQPFYLAYQGMNDRELQSRYGDLMVRIQTACFPEWAQKRPSPPPLKSGEPIRVGILSGFFHRHSNWKIPIKGWVENLNKEEFQLYGYYTGWTPDEHTESAKKSFYRFAENLPTLEEWLKRITDDRLHILIFPEIGMDPTTPRLAAFRLAPVQCASWGQPDTSGFPTVDYYLSSDLMEPENGQDHYCEKLVRLPNLSIHYEPLETTAAPVDRAWFGLRDDIPLFICTQSLFKYLPQYDEVFPRIAMEAGACQFAFINSARSSTLGERFLRRLETAFSRYGLRMEDYVKMVPHLDAAHYRAFNQLADVFLDSIGWSGCNTTMEALGCDLPVVTMPGELMRGRHTHAILKMMDLREMEGGNMDEYVAIAASLAKEPNLRKEISEKISRNRNLVYRDMECIRGLEDFIRRAVAEAMV